MRQIWNLNENWLFAKDVEDVAAVQPGQGEAVQLPHTWNGEDGQDGGNDYFRGTCSYQRTLSLGELGTVPADARYFLEICGANSSADVYVNGTHMAHHDGGYSTWRVDLTEQLTCNQEIQLCVLVDNAPNETVYPQMADFTFYGGLYRNVNLIAVAPTHFDLGYFGGKGLQITPVVEENGDGSAQVEVKVYVTNLQSGDQIRYQLCDADGSVVCEQTSEQTCEKFRIENAHLWDGIKDPYLYTAKVEIIRGEEVIDSVSDRFGCRSFRVDPENGFILNGREYPLRGVSRHQDRERIGNALLPCHHEEDMDLICEMGANTIRLAHYQHDQYFYDLCDERGMVIWAEIPYISKHLPGANENTVSQMKELIVQNYNHPSIVVWGLSNEITMNGAKDADLLSNHYRLNDLVHEMDKTRLTTMACVSMCGMEEEIVHISDVVSYNHYFGWYGGNTADNAPWFDKFHKKYPNKPIGCSEYGCEALNWHTSNPRQGDYTEEYQAYYHEELIRQFFSRKYLWATHVWNMFDFGADARAEGGENGQNHKGLVTLDRKYKKDAFYAYKAWLSEDPFVHLCGKRYVDRVEAETKITVYSNQPKVELFVNGESIGTQESADHFFYFTVKNEGESRIKAVAGECEDESLIRKVESPNEDYILKEQGAVLNWFDITQVEGRFNLNDEMGDIWQTFRGKLWFAGFMVFLFRKGKAAGKSAGGEQTEAKKAQKKKKSGGGIGSLSFSMLGGVLKMVKGFSVLRMTSMMGMINISMTKEELLKLNDQLNKIRKPKNK